MTARRSFPLLLLLLLRVAAAGCGLLCNMLRPAAHSDPVLLLALLWCRCVGVVHGLPGWCCHSLQHQEQQARQKVRPLSEAYFSEEGRVPRTVPTHAPEPSALPLMGGSCFVCGRTGTVASRVERLGVGRLNCRRWQQQQQQGLASGHAQQRPAYAAHGLSRC
jgi:hypothetical protein